MEARMLGAIHLLSGDAVLLVRRRLLPRRGR